MANSRSRERQCWAATSTQGLGGQTERLRKGRAETGAHREPRPHTLIGVVPVATPRTDMEPMTSMHGVWALSFIFTKR